MRVHKSDFIYAILDIETTGGKYNEEGITEIAIYKFDGNTVVDEFVTLVNPEKSIQSFVVGLTGINNEMLVDAPKFHEVAKQIIEITEGCILVAHNAQFDYRILSLEFDRLGYNFDRQTLCTVELSQELLPGHKSYSLGKLTKSLGIEMSNRHRADGDALATVKLLEILIEKDYQKDVLSKHIRSYQKKAMDSRLKELLETVPSETGVYYLYNINNTIIYIGKSRNMRKRVSQYFTNDNRKSKKIQDDVHSISYEETGSELIALLKENQGIKLHKPKYNRTQRRSKFKIQLTHYIDTDGYLNLKTEKANLEKEVITTYSNSLSAKSNLQRVIENYDLCIHKTLSNGMEGSCYKYEIGKCNGACVGKESTKSYNSRVQTFIDKYSYHNKNIIILERGRNNTEQSLLLIENGELQGFGFIDRSKELPMLSVIKSNITVVENNRDTQHIIQSYLRSKKKLHIIPIEDIINA